MDRETEALRESILEEARLALEGVGIGRRVTKAELATVNAAAIIIASETIGAAVLTGLLKLGSGAGKHDLGAIEGAAMHIGEKVDHLASAIESLRRE